MRPNFITWEQAVAEEAEGRATSMVKDMTKQTARKILALNLLSVEQIAEALGLSVQEVKELAEQDPSA